MSNKFDNLEELTDKPDLHRFKDETEDWRARYERRLRKDYRDKLLKIRRVVWESDVPSPTTPEYREFHDKMQRILSMIDKVLGADEDS